MKRILILGSKNSTRSQMAKEFLKRITFGRVDVLSAGVKPGSVHPLVIRVMSELGIDISKNESISVNKYYHDKFDYVITVCDEAREKCPDFQGSFTKIHKGIEDPSKVKGSDQDKQEAFRNVRDNIKEWLTDFAERYKLG